VKSGQWPRELQGKIWSLDQAEALRALLLEPGPEGSVREWDLSFLEGLDPPIIQVLLSALQDPRVLPLRLLGTVQAPVLKSLKLWGFVGREVNDWPGVEASLRNLVSMEA